MAIGILLDVHFSTRVNIGFEKLGPAQTPGSAKLCQPIRTRTLLPTAAALHPAQRKRSAHVHPKPQQQQRRSFFSKNLFHFFFSAERRHRSRTNHSSRRCNSSELTCRRRSRTVCTVSRGSGTHVDSTHRHRRNRCSTHPSQPPQRPPAQQPR